MRREHGTIVVEVLDELARLLEQKGAFHITVLAARANLPHDRLRGYLDELAGMDLVLAGPVPALTAKGRQFLDCYHAWVRIQRIYGLGAGPPERVLAKPAGAPIVASFPATAGPPAAPVAGASPSAPAPAPASGGAAPSPGRTPLVLARQGRGPVVVSHDPSTAGPAAEPSVRGG